MPGGGSGLGLTIASEIAAMHGGEVRIEDGAGQGPRWWPACRPCRRRRVFRRR